MAVGANKNIFKWVSKIGYRADKDDEYNCKTVVTNNLIIASLAMCIFLASLFYNQAAYRLFVYEAVSAIVFAVCLVLSAYKLTEASKIIGLFLANLSMFGFFSAVGPTRITALVVTVLAAAPMVMFESKRLIRTILFTILPIAAYYVLQIELYNVLALEELPTDLKQIVAYVLFVTSAVSIILCIAYLVRQRAIDTKRAEERQNLFMRISQITPNILHIYNVEEDRIAYSNDKMFSLLGYNDEMVNNISSPQLRKLIHPDDIELVAQSALKLFKSTADEPVETIYRLKNAKGEYVWIRNRSQVFERNKNGRVKLILGISEDITEKIVEQEHLYEVNELQNRILAASPYAIMTCDTNGVFTLFNRAAEEMFGYTAQEMIGKHTPAKLMLRQELDNHALKLTEELGIQIESSLEVLIQRPLMGMFDANEWTYIRKDGTRGPALLSVNALRDKNGNITGYLGISRDITTRKQKEVLLKKAKDLAEEANRTKSQFLANMGHEIRTPLNAILGMTELTLEGDLSAEQREYLGYVKESGDNLLHVINDILDYSKIESNHFELYTTDFNFYDTINTVLQAEGARACQKNLDFYYTIDENIPAMLIADTSRLTQALGNILNNAVKFTDRGSVSFSAQLVTHDDDFAEIQFTITDTGIGIPQDKYEFVFQAFAQIDDSHKRIYQGTGLGLSLARRLIELMKGKITVESELGKGSTFTFTIKLKTSLQQEKQLPDFSHIRLFTFSDSAIKNRTYDGIASLLNITTVPFDSIEQTSVADSKQRNILLIDIGEDDKILISLAEKLNTPQYKDFYKVLAIGHKIDAELRDALEDVGFNIIFKPLTSTSLLAIALQLPPKESYVPQGIRIESKLLEDAVNPLRFLIVEDNDINRMLTARVIEKMGYRVDTAVNGKQAVERFAVEQFDMVVMDIQMPEMDGMEATYHIRIIDAQRGKHTPIIAMTANAMKGDKEKYIEAGMDEYISKPFDKNVLEEKINELKEQFLTNVEQSTKNETMAHMVANGKVDLSYLEELLHGNNIAIREVLGMFITQTPQLLGEMHMAYNTGQLSHLGNLTHKLKGTLVAIGVNGQDLERLKNIERQSKEEVDATQLKPLLDTSTNRLLGIVDDLKLYITNLQD